MRKIRRIAQVLILAIRVSGRDSDPAPLQYLLGAAWRTGRPGFFWSFTVGGSAWRGLRLRRAGAFFVAVTDSWGPQ